jgi:thiamine-monophosphate kinase
MGEFELIRRYFNRSAQPHPAGIKLGIGDDCALLAPRAGHALAVSTDMLVEGRHFFANVDAEALGWKALAVNLSDLAGMGAQPLAFTLALALPQADEAWLEKFSRGLFACADQYGCTLVGGDTTKGPLNICITVFGEVPDGLAIRRSGAQLGDEVWVSGTLGDAALGLRLFQDALQGSARLDLTADQARLIQALERPTPRIELGLALRGIATALLDLSDGLAGDLGHILVASGVGAAINVDALPLSATLSRQSQTLQLQCALAGGDDYELCFTAPASMRESVLTAGHRLSVNVTRIGRIVAGPGLQLVDHLGQAYAWPAGLELKAYDHFG